jgi:centromere protein C
MYYIQNISNRDAKLFFAQARKVPVEEIESPDLNELRRSSSRAPSGNNPSSSQATGVSP